MSFNNPTIRFGFLTCRGSQNSYRIITLWKRIGNLNLKRNFRDDHIRSIGIGFEELIGATRLKPGSGLADTPSEPEEAATQASVGDAQVGSLERTTPTLIKTAIREQGPPQ